VGAWTSEYGACFAAVVGNSNGVRAGLEIGCALKCRRSWRTTARWRGRRGRLAFDGFWTAPGLGLEARTRRRIERVLKASHLPADKTLATLDLARRRGGASRRCARASSSAPRTSSAARDAEDACWQRSADLVQRSYRVAFVAFGSYTCSRRGRALTLGRCHLDAVDVDRGRQVHPQDRGEMEVFLYETLATEYAHLEQFSLSQWTSLQDVTTACVDRVVHHATILELTGASYRSEAAKQRNGGRGDAGGEPPVKEPKT
jgi:hypothetical protein